MSEGEWIPISGDDARKMHGVTCRHSYPKTKEELRFRLEKNDGTMYIRTEALKGGWQNSHWHKKVKETYIVQSGWIGYAESRGGEPELYIYREGESFTTPPGVIHTVYLPAGAVIHTVKHGQAEVGDRYGDDDSTKAFTARVREISDRALLERGTRAPALTVLSAAGGEQHEKKYGAAYMHFDTLIWQVPAWATGIFAIVFAGMSQLQTSSPMVNFINLETKTILAGSASLFGLMLAVLSYALYRFRWHQIDAKLYEASKHISPQIFLQFIVNVQAVVLILFALRVFGFPISFFISGVFVGVGGFTALQEWRLYRKGKGTDLPVKPTS